MSSAELVKKLFAELDAERKARLKVREGADPAVKSTTEGFVYFVQPKQGGLVKIGFTSRSVKERMKGLQAMCPVRLRCLGWYSGSRKDEGKEQVFFEFVWKYGEWFEPTKGMLEHIQTCSEGKPFDVALPCNSKISGLDRRSGGHVREETVIG